MKLIFEKSVIGRQTIVMPHSSYNYELNDKFKSKSKPFLPEIAEVDLVRHYTALSLRAYGVDNGFYPLGSCTMKYNPKINEEVASLKGFTDIHPLQPLNSVKGCLEVMNLLTTYLMEITGMDAFTLQPAAGAHGEYTGLLLIRQYHLKRGDIKRNKIIVPDSAHGTNPASASMAGFEVINIPSNSEHGVDLDALTKAVGEDTAALMLTNPTTLGLFEKNIVKISEIVHNAGGLLYYDGANLNAVMGKIRPGDMGFDVVHLNLHKTFSTPHGGGGPGSGPVGCKSKLVEYLPIPCLIKNEKGELSFKYDKFDSIGKVRAFYGNFLVYLKALTYIVTLGREGIKDAAEKAVLNANYLLAKVKDKFNYEVKDPCMHEFVLSLQKFKDETGVTALDFAKTLIDKGIHPPTMYFPSIVHEALMFEPTETESRETLDNVADIILSLYELGYSYPDIMKSAPNNAIIKRPDDVKAARTPVLRYKG